MSIKYDELLNLTNKEIEANTDEIDEIIEYEEILFEISKKIVEYRKNNNLTQQQLADVLQVNQVMISKLESGNYNPTFKELHKISRKLTNSVDLFIDVLQGMITNLNNIFKMPYTAIIEKDINSSKEEGKLVYINDYKSKGGSYGTEECTSSTSVAG